MCSLSDGRNRIAGLFVDEGSGPDEAITQYDAAGNITFDGEYFYQYDAWNRLVQVNEAWWDTGASEVVLGHMLKHHTYDGVGRLVRTQSPYPDPATADGKVRSERFYYDGLRRIQEVFTDPLTTFEMAMSGDDPELQQLAAASVPTGSNPDGDASPMALEEGESGGGGSSSVIRYLAREYIWGPGDSGGGGGFDECFVYFDRFDNAWWVLQDSGGDVVAVCAVDGADIATVAGQWTYDAYGAVLTAEHLSAFTIPTFGHKALFLDRLDSGVKSGSAETPRLVPFAHLLMYNRNRTYNPQLGRFNQIDPNQTAMTLLEATLHHGGDVTPWTLVFDFQHFYGDGSNLYQYLGSNTWERSDPLGLFFLGVGDVVMWGVGGMRGGLEEMLGQYAANMLADVEWAMDWDMGDDWHTRSDNSWVQEAFARGFYQGLIEQVQISIMVEPVYAGAKRFGARGARAGARGVRSMRDLNHREIFSSYSSAKRSSAKRPGEHAHHLVERQMGGPWRKNARGNGPAIHVESHFHLSNMRERFNRAYNGMSPGRLTRGQAERVIRAVYRDAPRLRNAALKYIGGR